MRIKVTTSVIEKEKAEPLYETDAEHVKVVLEIGGERFELTANGKDLRVRGLTCYLAVAPKAANVIDVKWNGDV